MEDGVWRTINGNRVFIKNKATNEYMNNFIKQKGKENKCELCGGPIASFVFDVNGKKACVNCSNYFNYSSDYKYNKPMFIDSGDIEKWVDTWPLYKKKLIEKYERIYPKLDITVKRNVSSTKYVKAYTIYGKHKEEILKNINKGGN